VRHSVTNTVLNREATFWRVLGRSSRTVGTFTAPNHLADWQQRITAAISQGAVPAEPFVIVELDELGVELSRRTWTPDTKEGT
jgi:hypothetical protein